MFFSRLLLLWLLSSLTQESSSNSPVERGVETLLFSPKASGETVWFFFQRSKYLPLMLICVILKFVMVEIDQRFAPGSGAVLRDGLIPDASRGTNSSDFVAIDDTILVANPNCIPDCPNATVPYKSAEDLVNTAAFIAGLAGRDSCHRQNESVYKLRVSAREAIEKSNATPSGCLGPWVVERFGYKIEWCRAKCKAEEGERPHFFERLTITRPQRSDQPHK